MDPDAASRPAALVDVAPFFSGDWPGIRSDWTGDVGVRFVAEVPCVVTALGRRAGGPLAEPARVTLWQTEGQEELASVLVGPSSRIEGHSAFEPLETPVPLEAGKEYRVSQLCRARMPDRWFDGYATAQEVSALTANRYARFVGSCCRNDIGFPNREDGEFRRAGMVNLKLAREGLDVVPVTREELAHALARAVVDEESSPEAVDAYLAVLARLLALLVDGLAAPPKGAAAPAPRAPALTVVAPEEELSGYARLEPLEARGAAALKEGRGTVFDKRFARDVTDFARRYRGGLDDYGGPVEGAFVVSHATGEVLAPAVRVLRATASQGASGDGAEERLNAADLAALLPRGMAFARSASGDVTAFVAAEVRKGRALRIEGPTPWPRPAPASRTGKSPGARGTPGRRLLDV